MIVLYRSPAVLASALLTGWLAACTTTPSSLELDADGLPGRAQTDAAWGPSSPGRVGGFGESDWRYGEFLPPQVNPEPTPQKLDFNTHLDASPFGAEVSDFPRGRADTDFFIFGTSEDVAGDDGEAGEGQGMAVFRIPF